MLRQHTHNVGVVMLRRHHHRCGDALVHVVHSLGTIRYCPARHQHAFEPWFLEHSCIPKTNFNSVSPYLGGCFKMLFVWWSNCSLPSIVMIWFHLFYRLLTSGVAAGNICPALPRWWRARGQGSSARCRCARAGLPGCRARQKLGSDGVFRLLTSDGGGGCEPVLCRAVRSSTFRLDVSIFCWKS